jgi:membrane protease YdiL (CAAX protease family)
LVGVGALLLAGFTKKRLYLLFNNPSRPGLVMLAALFLPMIPVAITGFRQAGWAGWEWKQALVYAPASGIAQELYFRSALLPALEKAFDRPRPALLTSTLMFSLFHTGMFTIAPVLAVFSALVVTFLVGLGWGWQTQRDRTSMWAMFHHALLQIILRLFAWM